MRFRCACRKAYGFKSLHPQYSAIHTLYRTFFVRKIKSDNLLTDIAAFILIIVLLSVANRLEYHHASKHKQFKAFD